MTLSANSRRHQLESRQSARHSMALHSLLWAFLSTPGQRPDERPEPGGIVEAAMKRLRECSLEGVEEHGQRSVQEALEVGQAARDRHMNSGKENSSVACLELAVGDLSPWSRGDHQLSGKRGKVLEGLHDLLSDNADIFELVTLNGSVGSRDMKLGWSDVDLFVSLQSAAFDAPDKLERVRFVAGEARRLMDKFCMFQMHGVFFCCPAGGRVDGLHPLACISQGRNLLHEERCRIPLLMDPGPAEDYFLQDIVASARNLLRKAPEERGVETIVLLHRVYSFPFAWAACFGHLLYKRESFTFLTREYGDLFPQAEVLHERASELFHTWDIPCAAFLEAQGELARSGHPMDEAAMAQLEPAAWSRIRAFVVDLEEAGMLEVFSNHLDIAEGYLMDGVSQMEYRAHFLSSVQRIFPAAISTEACFG